MFPVVVVVWISITVLPVEIINPKNDYCHVKTNYQKILKLNFCSVHGATLGRGKFGLESTPCVHSRNQYLAKEGILDMVRENTHFQKHAWEYVAIKH